MEQRKRLGVRVFIWALLSVLMQITNVIGGEFKIFIEKLITTERMGCGDMAPHGMERLKTDCSKEEYFDSLKNTNGDYQELRGLPCQLCFDHSSYGVFDIVWLFPYSHSLLLESVHYDKAFYDNYCPSGTEKGIVATFLFVDNELLINLLQKYYEKTGVMATVGMSSPATNTQHKEFLEYITKELREETVGVATKVWLESDSSYKNGIDHLNNIRNALIEDLLTDNFIAYSVDGILPRSAKVVNLKHTRRKGQSCESKS